MITPFAVRVSDAELADLNRRLQSCRWPERETVDDWSQGVPLAYLRDLIDYWLTQYEWRAREEHINRFPQFRTLLGGLRIHFYHVRSRHAHAMPLLLTHGWPGSVLEFLKVIAPLTAPEEHGGDPRDAFHVVCPSLPGYGFSDKPGAQGCNVAKIAALWDQLMLRLGYESYFAQGGDWGAAVTTEIAVQDLGHCLGIHVNMPIARPPADAAKNPTPAEQRAFAAIKLYAQSESGYATQQSTRPQTLGYGLVDSPVAQCAWIVEKFRNWMDCGGTPENAISRDELLDNVMMYWLPGAGASSARLYWESFRPSFASELPEVRLPTGCSQFAKELSLPPRAWVERRYTNLVYWNELPDGGHFPAIEQPAAFVRELRASFGLMRATAAADGRRAG
jgi:pimeloyl-ACP methyl ester carboxylesterase